MSEHSLKGLFRRWRDWTWRGPGPGWLVAFALVLVLGLGGLIAAGIVGLNHGLADQQQERQVLVEDHYHKGLAYLESRRLGLAVAEFEMVLQLDPGHADAARLLRAIEDMPVGTPAAAAPALVPPPTPDVALQTREDLFEQAQIAIQDGQWLAATTLLQQLTDLDADFRPADVEAMRFGAAYQNGQALAQAGEFSAAVAAFDLALELRPYDANAQREQAQASLAAAAMAAWGSDWATVVDELEALQDLQPGYGNVEQRLAAAWTAWGDQEAGDQRWCAAAEHYAAALAVQPSAELRGKRNQAAQACVQPTATPIPSPTPTVEASTPAAEEPTAPATPVPAGGTGTLYFAAFSSEFKHWTVFRLPLRGADEPLPVTDDASQPAISPNGRELAVRSERNDQGGLAVMLADGANRRRLTTFSEDSHASWSPAGNQLVFDSNREGDRRWRIYHTWAGGGDATNINYGRWPAWSPTEDTIAFQGCDETGNRCGIWLMDATGANPRPLTDVSGDAMPAWSPDGTRLAFASPDRTGTWSLFLVNVSSGRVTTLTSSGAIDGHPAWSPDGSQVAFLSNRDGAWAVYAVRVASGQVSKVVDLPGDLPDWFQAQIAWGR